MHGFTVHWRRGVCGRTKPSKNRTKDSGGFEDKELSGVRSQPLTVSSPCPKALHQWRRILPRGQSCALWGFLLLWLDGYGAHRGYSSSREITEAAVLLFYRWELCGVSRGTQLLSPDPQKGKNGMLSRREGYKWCHFVLSVVVNFTELRRDVLEWCCLFWWFLLQAFCLELQVSGIPDMFPYLSRGPLWETEE